MTPSGENIKYYNSIYSFEDPNRSIWAYSLHLIFCVPPWIHLLLIWHLHIMCQGLSSHKDNAIPPSSFIKKDKNSKACWYTAIVLPIWGTEERRKVSRTQWGMPDDTYPYISVIFWSRTFLLNYFSFLPIDFLSRVLVVIASPIIIVSPWQFKLHLLSFM